ncbi:MAG: hypothetical protein QHH02_07180, partial [Syntrophomonadaceae bacterium]|nr:hypothetical protein [Syntrophomonadaceae bacterium]
MAEEAIALLAPRIRQWLMALSGEAIKSLEEIRLRRGRPLILRCGAGELTVSERGLTCQIER